MSAPAGTGSPTPARRKFKGGVVVPHTPRWYQRLGAWLIMLVVHGVSATIRFKWEDRSGFFENEPGEQAIFCFWHNRLALCTTVYDLFMKPKTEAAGVAALVSASKDGAFLSAILKCFDIQAVRGSSSRRGPQALLELTSWAERGYNLAITPDGPRGPAYSVQEGVMSLAQLTGLPIVPMSYRLSRKIRVRSWDNFEIPLPFTSCDVALEKPVRVPREACESDREALRLELENRLKAISHDP
ncbi:MAG TPA: lysophospholipid acyltransferase family protein [Candidatus Dormibacteraeota bacterium]|nr:lysophospholipid acyltransferase family protein [Candidatus Dormibacteraeota bacterium]